MFTVEELLNDPEIKAFRDTNQSVDERIKIAANQLVKKEAVDAKQALIKLFPALTEKTIQVFFSFKEKDMETAATIVELLEGLSAGKLDITYQKDFTKEFGRNFREYISKQIKKANWFILLFPDPKDEWDWCLFETGFFAAQLTSADRLFCIYPEGEKPPSPIETLQSIPANTSKVESFLRETFLEDNAALYGLEAINPKLKDSDIQTYAQLIVDAIHKPKKMIRKFMEPWLELHVNNPGGLSSKEDLDEAIVREANNKAFRLFRLLEKKELWGEFRENLPAQGANDSQWREELFKVIRKIGKGHEFYQVAAVFQSEDGKMYRPVVSAIDKEDINGPIHSFHITFSADVSSVDRSAMPKDLSVLGNVLRSAFRFRWEVLEKFTKRPMTSEDVDRVKVAITRIQQDWESRDIGDEQDILAIFTDQNELARVTEMFTQWHEATNDENTGTLDVAIANEDTKKVTEILNDFKPVSQEFLALTSDKFAELASK